MSGRAARQPDETGADHDACPARGWAVGFPAGQAEGSRSKSPRTEGRGPSGGSYEPIRVDALCGSDDPRGQDRPMAWFPTREEDLEAAGPRNSGPPPPTDW